MRSNAKSLDKTPGPADVKTVKVNPGIDFTIIAPVNKKFGFTITAGTNTRFQPGQFADIDWIGNTAAASAALPAPPVGSPYMRDYMVGDYENRERRNSLSATLDFKLTENDSLSLSIYGNSVYVNFDNRLIFFNTSLSLSSLSNASTLYTHFTPGAEALQMRTSNREIAGTTWKPALRYRHNGHVWKVDGGASYSKAYYTYIDMAYGHFDNTQFQLSNVTTNFDDNYYLGPRTITVLDATGTKPVNWQQLANYSLLSANSDPNSTTDIKREAQLNAAHSEFNMRGIPIVLK